MCNIRSAVRLLTLSVLYLALTSIVLPFKTVVFFWTRRSNVTYPRFKLFSDVLNKRLFLLLVPQNKNTFKNDLHVESGISRFSKSRWLCARFLSGDISFKLWHIYFKIEFVRQINFCRRWECILGIWQHAIYDRQLNEWSQNEQKP